MRHELGFLCRSSVASLGNDGNLCLLRIVHEFVALVEAQGSLMQHVSHTYLMLYSTSSRFTTIHSRLKWTCCWGLADWRCILEESCLYLRLISSMAGKASRCYSSSTEEIIATFLGRMDGQQGRDENRPRIILSSSLKGEED